MMAQKSSYLMAQLALFSLLLAALFAVQQGDDEAYDEMGVNKQQRYGYCTPVPCYHTPGGLCYCCPKWDGCPLNFDTQAKCEKECPK